MKTVGVAAAVEAVAALAAAVAEVVAAAVVAAAASAAVVAEVAAAVVAAIAATAAIATKPIAYYQNRRPRKWPSFFH